MLVSVIIPTYRRSLRLPIAIDSVINQTYNDIEIIVVDDNNHDDYRKNTKKSLLPYLEKNQIIYIEHPFNAGGCAARNTGAKHSKGEYIAFLDDDDFYEPEKIELQIDFLKKNKNLDACMCSMFRINENKKKIVSRENLARGVSLKEAILDGNLFTSMLLIKKQVFYSLNGFSEISRFQDKFFHYKFLEKNYKIGILDKQLLTLVEHSDFRISLSAIEKIAVALDKLRKFEKKHHNLFSKKEWKYLAHRFYYNKAYNFCQGNFRQKIKGLANILTSIKYYTGDFNVTKIFLKSISPNFILKQKNNQKAT
ncbi:glycosyltransferase family 2 protein [Sabulilitoribacter arenilitoris]|uniref:Glycosyltransferase family 2 protein n=1 Tax=Wocania arenilitoris TaxID=2044858 RepID=A0AAE3ER95_9FLAO|nr:glycosyltransferase family 2 protein [Wocania arenilitoris]MCF7568650.1 glycosyltransferase family 2 protein [Wocania arenilitoris]